MPDPIEDAHAQHVKRMRDDAPRSHQLFDDLMQMTPTPLVEPESCTLPHKSEHTLSVHSSQKQ